MHSLLFTERYKQVLNNYLKVLKPNDEKDMEKLILKDMNYFFNNKNIKPKTRV